MRVAGSKTRRTKTGTRDSAREASRNGGNRSQERPRRGTMNRAGGTKTGAREASLDGTRETSSGGDSGAKTRPGGGWINRPDIGGDCWCCGP